MKLPTLTLGVGLFLGPEEMVITWGLSSVGALAGAVVNIYNVMLGLRDVFFMCYYFVPCITSCVH